MLKAIYIVLALAVASCGAFDAYEDDSYIEDELIDSEPVIENPQEEEVPENIEEATIEPEVIEEAQEPEYSNTLYSLSGYERSNTQSFIVNEDSVVIDGTSFLIDDLPFVIDGDTRIIQIGIEVDFKDSFLFIPSVCPDFFGIDLTRMSRIELEWIADVLRRYPEETIFDLGGEWNER